MVKAVLSHQPAIRKCALVSGQQVVEVHRARIDIFQIGSFQREDSGVWTVHLRVFADKIGGVISGVEILALAGANVHFVITGTSIEQPLVIDLTIEITKRTGEILFDEAVVA